MAEATPDPRAVVKRRSLAGGAVDIGDAIDAGGRAGSADKVTVQGAAHIPRVGLEECEIMGNMTGSLYVALTIF